MSMKTIRQVWFAFLAAILIFPASAAAGSGEDAPDAAVLTAMLHAFLAGASQNDPVSHDRFWSERLVYTSSSGQRFGKADIMAGFESSGEEDEEDGEAAVYTAEDIQVQQFGNTAVVAFRLVASPIAADSEKTEYFNTGTFLKEQGRWQVVAWQATKAADD